MGRDGILRRLGKPTLELSENAPRRVNNPPQVWPTCPTYQVSDTSAYARITCQFLSTSAPPLLLGRRESDDQTTMRLTLFLLSFIAATATLAAQTCTTTPGATVPDGSVNASANFTVGDGTVLVTLSNALADPKSAGQLLSGLAFSLSSGLTAGTLGSNSANLRRVATGGTFTDLGPATTGWAFGQNVNGGFFLCVLCTDLGAAGPSHLLIGDPAGSGTYASANASIAGNKPHNPFTQGTATFLINVPGVAATDSVNNATFFFSTAAGVSAPGSCSTITIGLQ